MPRKTDPNAAEESLSPQLLPPTPPAPEQQVLIGQMKRVPAPKPVSSPAGLYKSSFFPSGSFVGVLISFDFFRAFLVCTLLIY